MATDEGLFGKYKQCEYCGRPLPLHFEGNLCPGCQDAQLFRDVKEFIRANDVNEYEVAEHFCIPHRKVKEWIREGRIEYRTDKPTANVSALHCQRCGAPVTFGTLCPKCLKLVNGGHGSSTNYAVGDSKMHYLDRDHDDTSE